MTMDKTPEELKIEADAKVATDAKATADAKARADLINIKIDGEERGVSLDELKKMAEKSGGADERFRKASEKEKAAVRGLRIETLFKSLSEVEEIDEDSAKELAGLLGIDLTEFLTTLKELSGGDEEEAPGKKGKVKGSAEVKKIGFDDLSPELRLAAEAAQKGEFDKTVDLVKKNCKEALDKDEILGKMIMEMADTDDKNSEKVSDIKDTLTEMVFEDVQRRILAREQYGPELIESSLQRARARFKKFGNPSKTSKELPVLGLGPSGSLPAEVYAKEPVKRIASTEAGYEDNAAARVLQSMIQSARSSGK